MVSRPGMGNVRAFTSPYSDFDSTDAFENSDNLYQYRVKTTASGSKYPLEEDKAATEEYAKMEHDLLAYAQAGLEIDAQSKSMTDMVWDPTVDPVIQNRANFDRTLFVDNEEPVRHPPVHKMYDTSLELETPELQTIRRSGGRAPTMVREK